MRRALPILILALTVLLTVGVWAEDAAKKEDKPAEKKDEKKAEETKGDDKAAAEDEAQAEDEAPAEAKLVVRKFSKRKIYAGDIRSWTSPCAIRLRDVFGRIKYYEAAKESRKGSAQYWVYMTKANKVFKQACKDFMRATKHDLVCELGSVVIVIKQDDEVVGICPIPEKTKEFLEILAKSSEEV